MSVKLKSILTAAMFLATLTGSSLPTVPASASSVDAIRDGNLIAEANGIVLDSDADAAELAVLRNLNGGVLPQIDFENAGSVSHIDGLISSFWRTSGYRVEKISMGDVNYDGVITKADAEMITKALSNGTTSKL